MVKKKCDISKDNSASLSQESSIKHSEIKFKKKKKISSELVSMMKSMSQNQSQENAKESRDSQMVPKTVNIANMDIETTELENSGISSGNESDGEIPKKRPKKMNADQDARTIFVGNVDVECKKRKLENIFSKYGEIEAIRLRSAAPAQPEVSKKEAVIKKNVHPSRNTLNAYVRFKTKDMMKAALEANGIVFLGNHLRVDSTVQEKEHDRHCAVFVGNLPFECEEESVYNHFEECGDIANVRIIRDSKFSSGKGFGYVNFKSSDAVEVALQLDGKLFMKRNLRIQRCVKKLKINKKKDTGKPILKEGQQIGFMKRKSEQRMTLKFMKQQKDSKGRFTNKEHKKKGSANLGKFSGMKMIESEEFKKMKKSKQRPTRDARKKKFLSYHLIGNKDSKKKTK